jgi:hypothetical protein
VIHLSLSKLFPPKAVDLYICLFDWFSDELSGLLLCFPATADERAPATLSLFLRISPFPRISLPSQERVRVESHAYLGPPSEIVILLRSCEAKQSQTESCPLFLRVNIEVWEKAPTLDVPNE